MPSIWHILDLVLLVAVAVSAINFTLLGMILRTSDNLEKALLKVSPLCDKFNKQKQITNCSVCTYYDEWAWLTTSLRSELHQPPQPSGGIGTLVIIKHPAICCQLAVLLGWWIGLGSVLRILCSYHIFLLHTQLQRLWPLISLPLDPSSMQSMD